MEMSDNCQALVRESVPYGTESLVSLVDFNFSLVKARKIFVLMIPKDYISQKFVVSRILRGKS